MSTELFRVLDKRVPPYFEQGSIYSVFLLIYFDTMQLTVDHLRVITATLSC